MYPSRRLRLILILLIALCGVFAYSYSSRLSERKALEAAIAQQEARIAAALDRQAALKADLAQIDSPEYLDRVARQELDLALPGDKVLVLIKPTPAAAGDTAQAAVEAADTQAAAPGDLPVWQQWVGFFTNEAGPAP